MKRLDPSGQTAHRRNVLVTTLLVLVVTVAGLAGTKMVLTNLMTARGLTAMANKDYVAAESAFRVNLTWNWYERWRAPYNLGVALHHRGSWKQAEDAFSHALNVAPDEEICRVALNLAWTYEAEGDAHMIRGDQLSAIAAWQEAAKIASAAKCTGSGDAEGNEDGSDDGSNSSDSVEQQAETESRNQQKADEAGEGVEQQGSSEGSGGSSEEARMAQLNELNQQAQRQKESSGGGTSAGDGSGPGGNQGGPTW